MTKGDFFGEAALLSREPSTCNCRAVAHVELWSLSREALAGLLETNPHIKSKIQAVAAERLSVELESLTSQIESRLSLRSSNTNSKAAAHQPQSSDGQNINDDDWGEVTGDEITGDEAGAATAPPYDAAELESASTPSIYLSTPKAGRAGRAPSPGHPLPPSEHLFPAASDGGDDMSAAQPASEPASEPDAASPDAEPAFAPSVRSSSAWACAATSFSAHSFKQGGIAADIGTDGTRRASTMCATQKALASGKSQRLGGGVGRRLSLGGGVGCRLSAVIGCASAVQADERAEHKTQTFDELCNATADSIREGGGGEAAGLATIETMRRALGKIQGKKVCLSVSARIRVRVGLILLVYDRVVAPPLGDPPSNMVT